MFARKAFADQLKRLDENSAERASLERDVERINAYLAVELNRATNGLAIFASSGTGEFFEAIQLQAPIGEHWLFIGEVPHIYPLVRLIDQYPRTPPFYSTPTARASSCSAWVPSKRACSWQA